MPEIILIILTLDLYSRQDNIGIYFNINFYQLRNPYSLLLTMTAACFTDKF